MKYYRYKGLDEQPAKEPKWNDKLVFSNSEYDLSVSLIYDNIIDLSTEDEDVKDSLYDIMCSPAFKITVKLKTEYYEGYRDIYRINPPEPEEITIEDYCIIIDGFSEYANEFLQRKVYEATAAYIEDNIQEIEDKMLTDYKDSLDY